MLLMEKHLERWIFGYLRQRLQRLPAPKPSHVLFALCDHFEPLWGGADPSVGLCRVNAWRERYPELGREFRDVDGRPPRHTFFFPAEQYSPDLMAPLAELTRQGLAEVELHLHHRDDDAPQLEHTIVEALTRYASHGLLSRDANGALRYAFVHGNWCLANSGPWCGVDSELDVLWRTGCFADFTFPSAPDPSQPPIVNEIYWPLGDPKRARGHERGEPARVGRRRRDRILLVEGPLGFDRGGRFGVRMENGALSERIRPPSDVLGLG